MVSRAIGSSPLVLARRQFLRLAGAAAAGLLTAPRAGAADGGLEALHLPRLRLPTATANGARVPVVVETAYPLDEAHGGTVLEVVNPRDPVAPKGVFHFTPASGRAYVAFQARFDEGASTVGATARCPLHGGFTATTPLVVAPGAGGCAGGEPVAVADEVRDPVIRIPRLVADGTIRPGDVIRVQVKTRHPNRTGLARRDGRWVAESEPFHLNRLDVVYGGAPVSRFALTAALSDNPLITFLLHVQQEGQVQVTLTNTRGRRFEASHPIRFA
jgi:sulfur-oxidizing protein SoxY